MSRDASEVVDPTLSRKASSERATARTVNLMKVGNVPAVGIAISTVSDGNVVEMAELVANRLLLIWTGVMSQCFLPFLVRFFYLVNLRLLLSIRWTL